SLRSRLIRELDLHFVEYWRWMIVKIRQCSGNGQRKGLLPGISQILGFLNTTWLIPMGLFLENRSLKRQELLMSYIKMGRIPTSGCESMNCTKVLFQIIMAQ